MPGSRNWVGSLLLRAPASLRSIRNVPVLGQFVHRLSHRFVPDEQRVWAQIEAGPARGLWIELNPRTGQSYFAGDGESAVQKIVAERLRPGMVFYDLGANIGLFSLLAARLVGPSGRVFTFEPDADVAARLRQNIERNEFGNVTVVQKGVWSSTGQRGFVVAGHESPDRGTGTFLAVDGSAAAMVDCVALDDFVRAVPAPNAIKIDVEGAEVEVLRGAMNLLATQRPWVLCETHSDTNDRACRELLRTFECSIVTVDQHHFLAVLQ